MNLWWRKSFAIGSEALFRFCLVACPVRALSLRCARYGLQHAAVDGNASAIPSAAAHHHTAAVTTAAPPMGVDYFVSRVVLRAGF